MVSFLFYVLLFLFFFPQHNLAQNNGRVATSTSLTATDETTPWFSPSGDFAFGFQKLQDKDQFLLCIWYEKIQEKTIVWHANISNPVPRGSRLQLDSQNVSYLVIHKAIQFGELIWILVILTMDL